MKKKPLLIAGVALLAFAAYAAIRIPQWRTEDDIREAVFRYEFAHNGSGLQTEAKAYYLSVGSPSIDRAPRSAFLIRFQHHKPLVKSVADCTTDNMRVEGKRTGELGLIFRAGRIHWLTPDKVEVDGGYYEASVIASVNIYTAVRKHGRWVVVRDKLIGQA